MKRDKLGLFTILFILIIVHSCYAMPNNESMTLANEDDIILLKEVLTNEPLPNMRTLIIFEYVD